MSSRLMPPKVGSSNWQTLMISSGSCAVDFDVEHIHVGKALEQNRLAFHHRLAGERTDVAQAEHRRAVGHHRHQVSARRVLVGIVRILLDLQTGVGNAGSVGQAEIALRAARFGGS